MRWPIELEELRSTLVGNDGFPRVFWYEIHATNHRATANPTWKKKPRFCPCRGSLSSLGWTILLKTWIVGQVTSTSSTYIIKLHYIYTYLYDIYIIYIYMIQIFHNLSHNSELWDLLSVKERWFLHSMVQVSSYGSRAWYPDELQKIAKKSAVFISLCSAVS
jgi:hypothetical protein